MCRIVSTLADGCFPITWDKHTKYWIALKERWSLIRSNEGAQAWMRWQRKVLGEIIWETETAPTTTRHWIRVAAWCLNTLTWDGHSLHILMSQIVVTLEHSLHFSRGCYRLMSLEIGPCRGWNRSAAPELRWHDVIYPYFTWNMSFSGNDAKVNVSTEQLTRSFGFLVSCYHTWQLLYKIFSNKFLLKIRNTKVSMQFKIYSYKCRWASSVIGTHLLHSSTCYGQFQRWLSMYCYIIEPT